MTIENLAKGLEIFVTNGAKGYSLAAEHDIIYVVNAREVPLKLSQIRQLHKLGFSINKEFESWYLFT